MPSAGRTPARAYWRPLLAVLIVQAIYWFALSPVFLPTKRPLERLSQTSFDIAEVTSPDWSVVSHADFREQEPPLLDCCDPGYRAVRIGFDLDRIPDDGLGEVPVIGADNYQTRVNGTLVFGEGRMHLPDISYHGRAYRGINRLPASALKIGHNEIVYTLVRGEGGGEFFVKRPTLGGYPATVEHYSVTRFLLNDYLWISIVIGYLTALLATTAWARGGHQKYLFWLALLAAAWASTLFISAWTDPWLHDRPLALLGVTFVLAIPFAWVNLINSWGMHPLRFILPVSLVLLAISLLVATVDLWSSSSDAGVMIDQTAFLFSGIVSIAALLLLLRKFRAVRTEQIWEYAIFVLCATILLRDAVGGVAQLPHWGVSTKLTLPLLLVALMAAFLARNIRLFRSRQEMSAVLETQLVQRTSELEAAHARERGLIRRQAHDEERQRIMRDMHDGLGSNLMSMLVAARRGVTDPASIADGIQSAIDEMRLMIDSMDSVGETLSSALVLFRDRTRSRLEAAGIQFEWNDHGTVSMRTDLGPRGALQVFRILQEAVTNILKHADANEVRVLIDATDGFRIRVVDNGKGGDHDASHRGRGLLNMATRAATVNARLAVRSGSVGTTVELVLPLATTETAGHGGGADAPPP